ncbi:ATP-binding protein [Aliidongia dinghuensis]|nr:ATP-binding protein [Aliidongia dinghuensis]
MNARIARVIRSVSRGDALLALGALAIIWCAAVIHLTQERQLFLHAARDNARNLSQAFSEHILGEIRSVDQTLLLLRRDWSRDPDSFQLADWAAATQSIDELAIQLSLVGPTGTLLQTNVGRTAPIDLSDREHFKVQRDASTDALFISQPVLGRASGKWTIQFTRRLLDRSGAFAGVVVGSIDALQLSRFYESIRVGRHGAIALVGLDGVVRARAPLADGVLGHQMAGASFIAAVAAADDGVYTAGSELDGTRRIVAFQRVTGLPVVVLVGLSEADVLRPFLQDLLSYLVVCFALSAAVLCALAVSAHHRRRHRAAKDALDATLNNVAQGVLMIGPDRSIKVMNPKVAELLGLPPELLAGNPTFDDLTAWQIEAGEFGPATPKSALREFIEAGGIALGENVYERERPNGRHIEIRTRVLPDGSAVRTYTDVTQFRQSERALAEARDAAEQASEARARFLAVVSHEIRTPMNGVIGLAELLQRTEMTDEQKRWVDTLRASADHLLRLIDDILEFTRLNVDGIEFERVPFDPVAIAREAFLCIEAHAAKKGLAHAIIEPETSCVVEGDPARLRQVLINLLGNAVKFTQDGSVRLLVLPPEIGEHEATWHFLVQDTGIGIAADALPRLFHEFTQVDGSIARRFGGSGLGLAISKRLVERMGGTITISSEIARGSVFEVSVTLPLSAVPLTALEEAPALPSERQFCALSVLLAEDDSINAMVAIAMLERMGHRVAWVEDGAAAVEAATTAHFDLILMDMMMPVMDGLTATRAIRALPGERGQVSIYAFTANAFKEDGERYRKAGADGYLTKPIRFDALLAVTERLATPRPVDAVPEPPAQRAGVMLAGVMHAAPTHAGPMHFDEPVMAALIANLGMETAGRIRDRFLRDLPQHLSRIRTAASKRDWAALTREAHSLKGAAASLGLRSIVETAATLEQQSAGPDIPGCAETIDALDRCATAGAAALRAFEMAAA